MQFEQCMIVGKACRLASRTAVVPSVGRLIYLGAWLSIKFYYAKNALYVYFVLIVYIY